MPWLPTRAAVPLTLRSPWSIRLADQAEKLPDSKPSAKITSDTAGVFVTVGVGVWVGVLVGVGEGPGVLVWVGVRLGVAVPKSEKGVVISYILPSMILGSLSLSIARSTI